MTDLTLLVKTSSARQLRQIDDLLKAEFENLSVVQSRPTQTVRNQGECRANRRVVPIGVGRRQEASRKTNSKGLG